MALTMRITSHSDSGAVRDVIADNGLIKFSLAVLERFAKETKVFVNGDLIGAHEQPVALFAHLKEAKRTARIDIYTSVVWNRTNNEILVSTEAGRCVRPLFIVDKQRLKLTPEIIHKLENSQMAWNHLICNEEGASVVEYMDVLECSNSLVAMDHSDLAKNPAYTHMELHPSLLLGVLASMIPFSHHNQSPRNSYQSAMGKQAIGIYASNYAKRLDTLGHIQNYGQLPTVATRAAKYLNVDNLPNGCNVIVAIATYTGFNQEDAIIVNRTALERGLFNSTFFRTFKEQNNKNHATGEEEHFCNPCSHGAKLLKPCDYSKLDESGFVPENTYINDGDIIIGKCMPCKVNGVIEQKDVSVSMKSGEHGYIDKNVHHNNEVITTNGDGYDFAKVRVRSYRLPTIGDKLSSRHGELKVFHGMAFYFTKVLYFPQKQNSKNHPCF